MPEPNDVISEVVIPEPGTHFKDRFEKAREYVAILFVAFKPEDGMQPLVGRLAEWVRMIHADFVNLILQMVLPYLLVLRNIPRIERAIRDYEARAAEENGLEDKIDRALNEQHARETRERAEHPRIKADYLVYLVGLTGSKNGILPPYQKPEEDEVWWSRFLAAGAAYGLPVLFGTSIVIFDFGLGLESTKNVTEDIAGARWVTVAAIFVSIFAVHIAAWSRAVVAEGRRRCAKFKEENNSASSTIDADTGQRLEVFPPQADLLLWYRISHALMILVPAILFVVRAHSLWKAEQDFEWGSLTGVFMLMAIQAIYYLVDTWFVGSKGKKAPDHVLEEAHKRKAAFEASKRKVDGFIPVTSEATAGPEVKQVLADYRAAMQPAYQKIKADIEEAEDAKNILGLLELQEADRFACFTRFFLDLVNMLAVLLARTATGSAAVEQFREVSVAELYTRFQPERVFSPRIVYEASMVKIPEVPQDLEVKDLDGLLLDVLQRRAEAIRLAESEAHRLRKNAEAAEIERQRTAAQLHADELTLMTTV